MFSGKSFHSMAASYRSVVQVQEVTSQLISVDVRISRCFCTIKWFMYCPHIPCLPSTSWPNTSYYRPRDLQSAQQNVL